MVNKKLKKLRHLFVNETEKKIIIGSDIFRVIELSISRRFQQETNQLI